MGVNCPYFKYIFDYFIKYKMEEKLTENSSRREIRYFDISPQEIKVLFDNYESRNFDEDLTKLAEVGEVPGLAHKLKVDLTTGIDTNQYQLDMREQQFSNNIKERDEMPHFCEYVWEALQDPFLIVLIIAACFQIGIGASPYSEDPSKDWIDGLGIVFAIVVVVVTGSVTNYNKEKKFKEIAEESYKENIVLVKRNSNSSKQNIETLLVGDIIKLEYGMNVPADGVIISGHDVMIDESALTGESDLIQKCTYEECLSKKEKAMKSNNFKPSKHSIPSPLLLSGTTVMSGSGWMMVLAVGKFSLGGAIQETVKKSQEDEGFKTPLEEKLEVIADDIGKFGFYSAVLTLAALLFKLLYSKWEQWAHHSQSDSPKELLAQIWDGVVKEILSMIILCIAIIVVAIPEGLPLAVTLSLSFSVRKMMDDHNLVRRMHACETMGGANYICTDKTGTLTQNVMNIFSIFDCTRKIDTKNLILPMDEKERRERQPSNFADYFNYGYYNYLKEAMISNIDVEIDEKNEVNAGSKTDVAFFKLLVSLGEKYNQNISSGEIKRLSFNSDRKKMSTVIYNNQLPLKNRIHMKGAPEEILNCCKFYLSVPENKSAQPEIKPLTKQDIAMFKETIKSFDMQSLRSIALCYKDLSTEASENWKVQGEDGTYTIEKSDFTLIGVAAIKDTLKDNVGRSVVECRNAGINVIMVTGDNIDTAVSIANECNIINKGEDFIALEGSDFYNQIGGLCCQNCFGEATLCRCPRDKKKEKIRNINAFTKIASNLKVIARARPNDKYTLVVGLRELDNVVAVTGDGTNDAPALSKADVGFAMGILGTDAAKHACDIVILNDNFSSIEMAVVWGRNIFGNIRKFIQFQLSVNLSAVLLVFVSSCIGSESPISAIQMLWINLIMDSLGSLSLATEAPTKEVLNSPPYSRREYIITSRMWKHIFFQSLVQFTAVFLLYLYANKFIVESDEDRLITAKHLEDCFGDFPGEKIGVDPITGKHIWYILDGKKSSWNPITRIRPGLKKNECIFLNDKVFDGVTKRKVENLYQAFKWYNLEYGNNVHMTIIFNTFVLYTLFNQINSRILDDKFNIFDRIVDNYLFLIVFLVEMITQVSIIQNGGNIFRVSTGGLTRDQWAICVGIASITFVVSFILKLLKLEPVFEFEYKENIKACLCSCCNKKKVSDFEQFVDEEEMSNKQVISDNNNSNVGLKDNHSKNSLSV